MAPGERFGGRIENGINHTNKKKTPLNTAVTTK